MTDLNYEEEKQKEKTPAFTVQEVRQRLEHIESRLETAVRYDLNQLNLSVNFFRYQEATLWRIVELGWCAVENYEVNRISSAMLLTRAVMETSALLWHANEMILAALKKKNGKKIKKIINQVSKGIKADDVLPHKLKVFPLHVSDCIRSTNRSHGDFSRHYELVSEFCHPNCVSNVQWYSKIDYEKSNIYFGLYVNESPIIKQTGINYLGRAINISVEAHNNIDQDVLQKIDELKELSELI